MVTQQKCQDCAKFPFRLDHVHSVLPCANCLFSSGSAGWCTAALLARPCSASWCHFMMCRGCMSPHAKDAWAADVHSPGIPHVGQDHGLWRRDQPVGEQFREELLGTRVASVGNLVEPQSLSVQGILAGKCQCRFTKQTHQLSSAALVVSSRAGLSDFACACLRCWGTSAAGGGEDIPKRERGPAKIHRAWQAFLQQ